MVTSPNKIFTCTKDEKMILKKYKFGFLFLATVSLLFVIPVKKVSAQQKYMFCEIDSDSGRPMSTHCYGDLETCKRYANSPARGRIICVARPATRSMENK